MDLKCMFFIFAVLFHSKGAIANGDCLPLQNLTLGTTGIIHCSFQEGFFGIFWYNSTEVLNHDAILISRESKISGIGYDAGQVDVYPNGSLVIYNVSKKHESNYTVLFLKTTVDPTVRYIINVLVNAKTFSPQPRIKNCSDIIEICLQEWDRYSKLSCSVRDARLMIPLSWTVRTIDGDKNISSNLSVTNQTSFYTSTVTTTNPFIFSSILTLLVCKADDSTGLLKRNQSVTLIQHANTTSTSVDVITKYLKMGSNMKIKCSVSQFSFLVWQRKLSKDEYTPIIYAVLMEENFSHTYDDDYKLENDGSLAVDDVRVKHEGIYSCISGDGLTDDVMLYNTVVFILPVPAYPVIEGCNHEQFCVLEVETEGSLTCTVKGIRPRVQLDLRSFFDLSSHVIEFSDKQLNTIDNDDGFDVSLTSKYRVKDTTSNRVTIECRVIGTEIGDLHLATKFDLFFMTVESTKVTENVSSIGQYYWIIIFVITIAVLLIVLCGIIIIRVFYKKRGMNGPSINESTIHERQAIYKGIVNEEEVIPMLEQPTILGKLGKLRSYFQCAYELRYKAIQPVPYIRDKLFCVNEVFVEGGIELNNVSDKSHASCESSSNQYRIQSKSLKSFRDIFDDKILTSKRIIVEGEPGYGKSTLTLQAAYDWCNENSPSSALKGAELLILLPLRLLKGITSIYEAMQLCILPRECTFTESEIKSIINSCTTVILILDGYDEYPDMNSNLKSDIMEIIKGEMFGNYKVILSTRSGCLPKMLDPRAVRVRLTGFDADARDKYIRMTVVGDSSERTKEIRENLEKNPIMCDLCQVPLFFVMFAHMAHESKDIYKCNSVTSFFKYMIHCFYNHMWKKYEEMGALSRSYTTGKRLLYKLAFDGLAGEEQTIVWEKGEFRRKIGNDCFEELIRIGILVEEKSVEINMTAGRSVSEYIQEKNVVRFYHKLFAEWYAAHYVSERAASFFAFGLSKTLRKVNPIDLQFVFRFACGLKPPATKRIVNYLRKIEGGDPFATLCILEQTGGADDILDTVREMCSEKVTFSSDDSQLLQRSRMQLLNIAAKNQIPISSVQLYDCFQSVDLKEESLCLSSGVQLPRLDTLQELVISFPLDTDLRDRARDVLDYSARCVSLKSLKFGFGLIISGILLPQSFDDRHVLTSLHRKNCKVQWSYGLFESGYGLRKYYWRLNLQSGKWEDKDGKEMTVADYQQMAGFIY